VIAPKMARFVGLACVTCSNAGIIDSPAPSPSRLDADTIVLVGQRTLRRTQIEQPGVATIRDIGQFISGWSTDALLAEAAQAGLLESSRLHQVRRSVLARALLERTYERAKAAGAPSDSEVAELAAERWFEVDRPEASRTSHFVVQIMDAASSSAALQLARKIADAVKGIADPLAFVAAAKAAPSGGLRVTAESLPPMTADGRGLVLDKDGKPVGEGSHFDTTFARAANSLQTPGSQSGLLRTVFGFHVILLEKKIAAYQMPLEDRRQRFAPEVFQRRARKETDRIVDEGKRQHPVQIESAFQELIVKSQVTP
jgi:hypothetical protein